MGAAAVRSQQGTHVFMFSPMPGQRDTTNNQFTSNAHPSNSPKDMACEACNVNFNIFKRKVMQLKSLNIKQLNNILLQRPTIHA